ncbi:MAG TPA: type II secretion system protein [Pseudolabrys sp.]|nr:type II secretion system protein [Pseudolabrys sp.]
MLLRRNAADRIARNARGFVLLEVLVAVGVAAIIMTALLRSFTSTWAGINAVREEAESMLLARALLADGSSTAKIAAGTQNGTVGRYAWSLTAVAVPIAPPPPPQKQAQQPPQQQPGDPQPPQQANGEDQQQPNPFGLYRITLVVTTPSGRSSSLETYRIGPAAAQ